MTDLIDSAIATAIEKRIVDNKEKGTKEIVNVIEKAFERGFSEGNYFDLTPYGPGEARAPLTDSARVPQDI